MSAKSSANLSAKSSAKFFAIGHIDDIPVRGARRVVTPNGRIAVFRTAADEVYAIDDRCPHKGGPLSEGIVHGRAVTCPLHNWNISLETGCALGVDEGQARTYEIRNEEGRLFLSLEPVAADVPAKLAAE